MTQDNVEKIRDALERGHYLSRSDAKFIFSHIDTLNLSLSGKTNFDEVAELKRRVKSQDEITAALHIVNAELGRRVESQKEEIGRLEAENELLSECNDAWIAGQMPNCEVCHKLATIAKDTASDCAEIARDQCFGVNAYKAIRTKYSLPKEE